MKNPQLSQLQRTLLNQGYPRSYVTRLCDELQDHYLSILETEGEAPGSSNESVTELAIQRIGSSDEIATVVNQSPELQPLLRRFPVAAFILLPGAVMAVASWLLIHSSSLLGQTPMAVVNRWYLVEVIGVVSVATPLLLTIAISMLALRNRCHGALAMMSAGFLSLGGLYDIQLAACEASESVFHETTWSFSIWKFATPWLGWMLVTGIGWFISQRRPGERGTRGCLSMAGKPAWAGLVAVSVTLFSFFVLVENARVATAVHPADSIIEFFSGPESFAAQKLQIICQDNGVEKFDLSAEQGGRVARIIQTYEEQSAEIRREFYQANPKWRAMDLSLLAAPISLATTEIEAVFSEREQARWNGLAYRSLDWRVYFRPEVQRQLGLNRKQVTRLKDLMMERNRAVQLATRGSRKANPDVRAEINERLSANLRGITCQMRRSLTEKQAFQLDRILGSPDSTQDHSNRTTEQQRPQTGALAGQPG